MAERSLASLQRGASWDRIIYACYLVTAPDFYEAQRNEKYSARPWGEVVLRQGRGRCRYRGMCLSVCLFVYVLIGVEVAIAYECESQRSTLDVVPQKPSTLGFETGFPTVLQLAGQLVMSQRSSSFLPIGTEHHALFLS